MLMLMLPDHVDGDWMEQQMDGWNGPSRAADAV